MRSRIQDGAGTTVTAGVFDDKMKEFEVQQSATNYISTSILEGRTGVFTVKITKDASGTNSRQQLLSIDNNDPVNLMVINQLYVQIISMAPTLPDIRVYLIIENINGTASQPIINDNRFSTIQPLVTSFGNFATNGTITSGIKLFPIVGEILDIIPPNSDGIILKSATPATGSGSGRNIFAISIVNTLPGSLFLFFTYYAFIKFMMVPPTSLG